MTRKQPPRARKRPRQSRSLALVRAVQEACLKILTEEGADRLTTQRIADVAGVNIASVYQYFPNKEAILADVYEEEIEKLETRARTRFRELLAVSEHSLERTLAAIVDWEIEQLLALYRLHPSFYSEFEDSYDAHQRIDALTQRLRNPSWEQWFTAFLRRHRHDLQPGDLELLSFTARQALSGTLREGIRENQSLVSSQAFRDELLRLLLGYLLAGASEQQPSATPPEPRQAD